MFFYYPPFFPWYPCFYRLVPAPLFYICCRRYAQSLYNFEEQQFYEPEGLKHESYCELQPFGYDPSGADHVPQAMTNNISHPVDQSEQRPGDLPHLDIESLWNLRTPELWAPSQVIEWLFQWAEMNRIDKEDINTIAFNIHGSELCQLSRDDFISRDSTYGSRIYEELFCLKNQCSPTALFTTDTSQVTDFQPMIQQDLDMADPADWNQENRGRQWVNMTNADNQRRSPYSNSDQESTSSSMTTVNEKSLNYVGYLQPGRMIPKSGVHYPAPMVPPGMKKIPATGTRRGRPRKNDAKSRNRQGKGTGKLWEFIRDLLLNPATNPSLIRWERREDGIFKFVQSDKVAKMWGDRKQNPRMTYEKLSRAMRTYYRKNIIEPVDKKEGLPKKLVYKFGHNATGWWSHFEPSHYKLIRPMNA